MRTPLTLTALALIACTGAPDPEDSDAEDTNTADPFAFAEEDVSAYARVDRIGMPAVNTAVITSKDDYNAADPADDAAGDFVSEITANVTAIHGLLDDDLASLSLTPCAAADCVAQAAPLVVPDTLKIDTTAPAGFPNGRLPADPVVDITLAVVLLDLGTHGAGTLAGVPLNPPANDIPFPTEFPWLAAPHE